MNSQRHHDFKYPKQLGFSMVEMLLAAFILAIGILGLLSLQTMSLKAATSGRGLTTAVLIAERVLDEIEANARNTLLYRRNSPPVALKDELIDILSPAPKTFNFSGRPAVGDPIDSTPYFTATVISNPTGSDTGVVTPVPALGGIAFEQVDVTWTETSGAPARHVVLSRRVAYATN